MSKEKEELLRSIKAMKEAQEAARQAGRRAQEQKAVPTPPTRPAGTGQ